MTIAALALLLAACGNEEIIENNESGSTGKVHMTFTAGMPQTRTSLADDGLAVNWTQGDLVAIYDGTETICKFEATEVSGSTATDRYLHRLLSLHRRRDADPRQHCHHLHPARHADSHGRRLCRRAEPLVGTGD